MATTVSIGPRTPAHPRAEAFRARWCGHIAALLDELRPDIVDTEVRARLNISSSNRRRRALARWGAHGATGWTQLVWLPWPGQDLGTPDGRTWT